MKKRLGIMGLVLALTLALGCGSKVNRENFDRIENDMTREEVVDILGEPTDAADVGFGGFSGGMSTWEDDDGNVITIQFVNGKVKGKQFAASD